MHVIGLSHLSIGNNTLMTFHDQLVTLSKTVYIEWKLTPVTQSAWILQSYNHCLT